MKVQKEYVWISTKDFERINPLTAEIIDVQIGPKEKKLILKQTSNKAEVAMSVWGQNWNRLVNDLGDDTDKWLGAMISILATQDVNSDKWIKTIQVLTQKN